VHRIAPRQVAAPQISRSYGRETNKLGAALKPSTEEAKDYLRHILAATFPKPDEVAEGMRVTRVVAITSLVGRRNIGDGLLMARERLIFQIARFRPGTT
jgi:hypothetical protein